jgi:hypothetical protein
MEKRCFAAKETFANPIYLTSPRTCAMLILRFIGWCFSHRLLFGPALRISALSQKTLRVDSKGQREHRGGRFRDARCHHDFQEYRENPKCCLLRNALHSLRHRNKYLRASIPRWHVPIRAKHRQALASLRPETLLIAVNILGVYLSMFHYRRTNGDRVLPHRSSSNFKLQRPAENRQA